MSNNSPVVFLVDDDPSILKALVRLLNVEGFQAKPFLTPSSFLDGHDPDIPGCIVLDVAMPGLNGLDLQRRLGETPQVQPIIFISGNSDVPTSVNAMKSGAVDFLTKPVTSEILLAAIRKAVKKDGDARKGRLTLESAKARVAKLTPREKAVFDQVVTGRLNKQIAGDLGIVEKTVKVHRARMMRKMGVRSLAELVHAAIRIETAPGQ